uniref:Uncharacterized protein n=1 Tax=Solanum lycopersicum TaxID=4081 RepID=A0A3Q7F8W5_SOLLC
MKLKEVIKMITGSNLKSKRFRFSYTRNLRVQCC